LDGEIVNPEFPDFINLRGRLDLLACGLKGLFTKESDSGL